jgi:hypothetical protein
MHLEYWRFDRQRAHCAIGTGFAIFTLLGLLGCGPKKNSTENSGADQSASKTPATVQEAAQVLDLSTIPLMDGSEPPDSRQVANLSYLAKGDVKATFEFHRKAFLAQGWKELPNSSVTDQSASASFGRNGFVVFLSVMPNGPAGNVAVMLQNAGNMKPGQLPVPPASKPVYVGDSTAMYSTENTVPATADAVRKLFLSQGWIPYGSAGDSNFYKQNAILVTATVSAAPAQGGKTMIQYSGQLISADIPAPPDVTDLRYADQPPELTFESAPNQNAIVDFYRKTLAAAGWQSTLDHTVAVDDKPTMIFRNPAKDMLTLSFSGARGGKLAAYVRFQSAAEVAELDRKIKEQLPGIRAAAKKKEEDEAARQAAAQIVPKVPVTLPAGATDVKESKDSIKFTVAKGKGRAAAENLRAQFRAAGWKEDVASLTDHAGTLLFSKEGQSVNVTYSDTGFLPTEVSLSSMRAEFQTMKP